MDEFLAIFLNWQFGLLCMGISAVTFVIRTIIEFSVLNNPKLPGNSQAKYWREFILVIIPIILGFVFPIFAKSFPYPTVLVEPISKFLFGSTAGLLSPLLYRVIKAALWSKTGSQLPEPIFSIDDTNQQPVVVQTIQPIVVQQPVVQQKDCDKSQI